MTTDWLNNLFEYSSAGTAEVNNEANLAVTSTLASYPDLLVSDASSSANSAAVQQTISVTYTVENQGTAEADADWTDRIYLSSDQNWDGSDLLIASEFISTQTPLATSGSYDITRDVTIPRNAPLGGQYLLFVTDASTQQTELDDDNNVRAVPLSVGAPNLLFEGTPTSPTTATTGESIPVSWTVLNNGTYAAHQDWVDRVYLSSDVTLDGTDFLLRSESAAAKTPLEPGHTYSFGPTVTIPSIAVSSSQYLLFIIDAQDVQQETTESDNLVAVPIDIGSPDLIVSSAAAPDQASPNESIPIAWTVQNQDGTYTARR